MRMVAMKTFESKNFISRELSWLEFNKRVFDESKDKNNPLLERIYFLSITSSNLDEFFMTRVSALINRLNGRNNRFNANVNKTIKLLKVIRRRVELIIYKEYKCFNKLTEKLEKEKILIVKPEALNNKEKTYISSYYNRKIISLITPIAIENNKHFPFLNNKALNLAFLVEKENKALVFATLQLPLSVSRLVKFPNKNKFILLEDVIKMFSSELFKGYKILSISAYRITRNADLKLDKEVGEDLLETIEHSIKRRKRGEIIRIEVEENMDKRLLKKLKEYLKIDKQYIYKISGPIDLTFLNIITNIKGYGYLRYPKFEPKKVKEFEGKNIFKVIQEKDVLLSHPYQRFQYIVDFLKEAANDPKVCTIKQTLYRVSEKSPIIEALIEAAENGKEVMVIMELKARFDERNNIICAKRLENAGCHVIYGLVGLKIHGKLLIVVRREGSRIKRYVHMATGNYNETTANFYTDLGLFTSKDSITKDVLSIFNMLSGCSKIVNLNKLFLAPINMKKKFIDLINEEIISAKEGKNARIIVKINSLEDKEIIEKLYEASVSGVKIDLIVRGICCLRPNYGKTSKNINVISIVGRFLEHSRIFYFYNGNKEKVYLSSADWMTRNLDRRIEILFPIEDKKIKLIIKNQLKIYLMDNVNARRLKSNGTYEKINSNNIIIDSQKYFQK
ncbi:polyphosphate kinase 1 [Clostridium felsineum]|uniref:polyphosphate kinase 1 n=2 Tax=Clostridium felsineum TaxID=36839 RepID=UPI0027DCC440|nr:polyphosphate kinase 1 [Clostridium felsineum]